MEWISVKDRLPDGPETDFIVCNKDGPTFAIYGKKSKKFYNFYERISWEVKGVTHWMPLPELPKNE